MNWCLYRYLTFIKDDTAFFWRKITVISWNYIRIIGNGRINFYSSSGNFSQNEKLHPYDWIEKKYWWKSIEQEKTQIVYNSKKLSYNWATKWFAFIYNTIYVNNPVSVNDKLYFNKISV